MVRGELSYAVFKCPMCGGKWAETVPPMWSEFWPVCSACACSTLLAAATEVQEKPQLVTLLEERDWEPLPAVRYVDACVIAEAPPPAHAMAYAYMILLASIRATPLAMAVPASLFFY